MFELHAYQFGVRCLYAKRFLRKGIWVTESSAVYSRNSKGRNMDGSWCFDVFSRIALRCKSWISPHT